MKMISWRHTLWGWIALGHWEQSLPAHRGPSSLTNLRGAVVGSTLAELVPTMAWRAVCLTVLFPQLGEPSQGLWWGYKEAMGGGAGSTSCCCWYWEWWWLYSRSGVRGMGVRGVGLGGHKLTAFPFPAGGNSLCGLCAFLGWAGGSACLWVSF